MIDKYLLSDINFIKELNNEKPVKPPMELVSDFVENKRIMPSGTPFPGPVDLSLTPFAKEWMDNMSPYSPIQHQIIKKAAQVAATFAIENIIGYWMGEFPTAILYMSATQALLEKWATKRLEPMIDSCGIRKKIVEFSDQTFGRKSRRTGDKVFQKLFTGGFLEMASAQSAASQRSDSIRVLIRDETEGAKKELTTGEGSWLITSEARTKMFGTRKKITDLSTPALLEGSYIDPAFEAGDQRHYEVPCPHCHKMQDLIPIPESEEWGLHAKIVKDLIKEVFYICKHCGKAFKDNYKYEIMNDGKWVARTESKSPVYRSYYINSLYSPPQTVTWTDYYTQWRSSKGNPELERGFKNLWAGHSYVETGARPKITAVNHLRGTYKAGIVPDGALFLTAAIDVQRGQEKYELLDSEDLEREIKEAKKEKKIKNFPRLEMEVLAHGAGYRTWSVCYKRFEGHLKDIDAGAWGKLSDFFKKLAVNSDTVVRGFKVPTFKCVGGNEFEIPMVFVDARDGKMTDYVYSFCQKYDSFYPSMGVNKLADIHKKGDAETTHDKSRFKVNKVGEDLYLYLVSTNYYKKTIYNRYKIDRLPGVTQRAGFMDHPKEYTDIYFKMLFAEEHRSDGSFHAGGRRNEALDIKVYNLCAADAYLDLLVNNWRQVKHKEGYSMMKVKNEINTLWVLGWLENKIKGLKKVS